MSFETPEYTANADALGTLRVLEAIRLLGMTDKTKFYQASTSELYGLAQGNTPDRKDSFLSKEPLRCCKTLCLLDNC